MVRTLFASQKSSAPFARIQAYSSRLILGAVCIFSGQTSLAQVYRPPGFRVPEIVMRADSGHSYKLPPATYFGLENPIFTNSNDIILQYVSLSGEDRRGLLSFNRDDDILLKHECKAGSFPSGVVFDTPSASFFYEDVNEAYYSNGIIRLSKDFFKAEKILEDSSIQFLSDVGLTDQSQSLLVRSKYADGSLKLHLVDLRNPSQKLRIEKTLMSTTHNNNPSPYSYIFSHSSTSSGYIALKVRLGQSGEIADSQPDKILIFKWDPEHRNLILIDEISDRDADPTSSFLAFDNSILINEAGRLLFVARLQGGRRAIYTWAESKIEKLVEEKQISDLDEIMYFAPDMNLHGDVVFRARGQNGESIWHVSKSKELTRLIGRGDRVKSDMGAARVGPTHASDMTFYLAPRINDHGIVLVGALIDLEGPNARPIGLGFYLIKPE